MIASRVSLLLFLVSCAKSDEYLKGNLYDALPPIFQIDDYEGCKKENKLFCKVSIVLDKDNSSESIYWSLIQKSIEDKRAYNHNELFHAICADNFCSEVRRRRPFERSEDIIRARLANCYNARYRPLGLVANITNVNCTNHDDVYKPGLFDYLWLIFVVLYVTNIMIASHLDYRKRRKDFKPTNNKYEKVYMCFSLVSNWEKVKQIAIKGEDQKLKCIQGIRFYNMLLVIFCHTYSSYVGGYIMNTSYLEEVPHNPVRLAFRNLFSFLVQTFFLFSGFLLSTQLFQIMYARGTFNKKYILLTFLNRYLRILPIVLFGIGCGSSIWVVRLFYGPIKELFSDVEYQKCQKNWWASLLFINNHYNQHDMCYFITWYLAADTQLYALSLIVLSLVWIFPHRTKQILLGALLTGIGLQIVISYVYNLDILYRISPENSKNHKFRSFSFNAIYTSMTANMATYMLGLCIGFIYHQMRQHQGLRNMIQKALWWFWFLVLPATVVTLSSFYYSRILSSILCGLLKPLYALGIALGILGMSINKGGIVKSICEWKPATFLANFTYSTYMVQYGIVFYRTATVKEPLYVSDFVLITSFIQDAFLSFLGGFAAYMLVELPFLQIQSLLVPKVRVKDIVRPEKDK